MELAKQNEMEKRKSLILARYEWSKKWRDPWDTKWLRWYKLFRGAVPALPKGEEDRSNLHIPYTYSTVDTVRSKLMTALFANRPWIAYIPKDSDDMENAKNMETLVDSQLTRADAKSLVKFYQLITDMLIYGACPFETGWRYEVKTVKRKVPMVQGNILLGYQEQEIEVPEWDDPDWQPFMVDDLFPDPEGTSIDDCAWLIRRRYLTEAELKEKEKQGIYKVKDWDNVRAGAERINEGKQNRLAAIGAGYDQYMQDSDVGGRRYELLEMWEDDRVTTLINRAEVIRDEKNPFWHGKKPIGLAKFDPLNGEFYGVSLVEVIEYLQAELNTTRNQRIDAVSVGINRMWKVLKSAGIEPADLVSRANGIIWMDNFEDAQEVDFKPVDSSAFQEESIIKSDIQEATATYSEVRGAASEDQRTATENAIRDRAVSLRFEVKAKIFETLALRELGFFFDQLNQQFVDDARQVRTETEEGYEWSEVTPESIAGRYEYQPAGSALDATLDALNFRDNLITLYDRFKEDPEVKQREMKKRVLEAFGIKDAERLLKTEQEMAQEQQQALAVMGGGLNGGDVQGQVAQAGGWGQIPAAG